MFQPWFVEIVRVLSDVLVGLSAVAVAVIGFFGLQQWRKELKGRTTYEVARRITKLAFQFRDEYKRARNQYTSPTESTDRRKGEDESRIQSEVLDEFHARRKRLHPLQETLSKLYEVGWEAEAVLDPNIGNLLQPLENSFKELYVAVNTYFGERYRMADRRTGARANDDWLDPYYHRIYGPEDDDISQAIDNAVSTLTEKLKSFLI